MAIDQPIHILFVEDVPQDAELAERALRKEGLVFTSVRVETRDDFLAALATFQPDLIVSDYSLPEFDGLQALKLSLEHDPILPVILMTGSMNEETAVACIKAGATDYVLKDRIIRLPFAVKEALEQKTTRLAKDAAEQALRESQRRLATLISNLPGMAYRCKNDPDWTMEFVSEGCLALTGYESSRLINSQDISYARLIHPADREMVWNIAQAGVQAKQPYHMEYRIQTASGLVKWVWEQGQAIHTATGQLMALEGFITDITERKQAEEALHESEERFRVIFEHANDAIHIDNAADEIIQVNSRLCELLGYSREELLTMRVPDLQAPELRQSGHVIKTELARYGNALFEGLNLHRSGRRIPVELSVARIVRPQGDLYVSVVRDITERKQAEEALRESEELMSYIVRHDPNAIAVYDRNLQYLVVSDRYLKDYDVVERDIIGKHHYEVFPEMPQRWKEVHQRCLAGAIERNDDDYFERSDGSITYNRWECRPWRRASGDIGGIITYTEVTTERKQAEEEIKKQVEELRRWHTATLGRETRILEVKRELNELLRQIGQPPRYPSAEGQDS